ncbi:Holliday junction branch migration protein RuvA [Candidatus Parcubacteria bacterium]|nr:MAG: Holliday junction branch migration protein RuvA [Candidatus Parcubacteria bacterium]
MIASLEGSVQLKTKKYVVVKVDGVGYKVFTSPETLSKLPAAGGIARLFTTLEVRENAHELYGFLTNEELEFYETLRTVSGIGPKSAIGILSLAPVKILASAIINKDTTFLTKVPGIGKKTAELVVVELKDKLQELNFASTTSSHDTDLIEALTRMGYGVKESAEALSHVNPSVKNEEERIREALKTLSKSKR